MSNALANQFRIIKKRLEDATEAASWSLHHAKKRFAYETGKVPDNLERADRQARTALESLVVGFGPRVTHTDRRAIHKLRNRKRLRELIGDLGSRMHERWRAPRWRSDNDMYVSRPKETKDKDWIRKHNTKQLDIANTKWSDLPKDWQQENRKSSKLAIRLVIKELRSGRDPERSEFIEYASKRIHNAWLIRKRATASPEQLLKYEHLSGAEQEKDRIFVEGAKELVKDAANSLKNELVTYK